MPKKYLDFDLAIERSTPDYLVQVTYSPGGTGDAAFSLPFDDTTLENLLLRLGHTRKLTRGTDSAKLEAAKKLGGGLFDKVFAGDILRCWQSSLLLSEEQSAGLRLRLRLNKAPELADLPWEFLYDRALNRFFNHSADTPLVRYLDLPSPPRPLKIQPPLKILVMISLPSDVEELDAESEWTNLKTSLKDLEARGMVTLERSEEATMLALQRKLRLSQYHILHFIGHGAYEIEQNESVLFMEDAKGRARSVSGQQLGTLLYDHRSLRLVVLNACEGARSGRTDPYSGVAQSLIQQGIPAVVAMQFPITDTAALILSREFYTALADNYPLDAALSEARKALYLEGNESEWATPVLYMRAPEGVIFDVQGSPPPAPPSNGQATTAPTTAATPTTQPPAREALTYEELVRRARNAQTRGDQIWTDTPVEEEAWRAKFNEALGYLERAEKVRAGEPEALLVMAQVQARLDPLQGAEAKKIIYRLQDLIGEPANDDQTRILGEAYLLHGTLSTPPNEKLLQRAYTLFDRLNDYQKLETIDKLLKRAARPYAATLGDFYDESPPRNEDEFKPIGKWNIQVQDMVGSRMYVEFAANGTFQMTQQVGTYQVPVSGSWTYNPRSKQLSLQGVINTFQPFVLIITISGKLPNGFAAVGKDGISYIFNRS